jgi:NAD(P)-dependent dehydrogenase (short-subunit alcohol dehydrogenase family)
VTWDFIEKYMSQNRIDGQQSLTLTGTYGQSKAMLHCMTMMFARTHPHILSSAISPGFVATNMTAKFGGGMDANLGTASIRHCLFKELGGNGWYFGSDCLRSPLHASRNPGEPAF